jgi:hypothetical protein
MLNIVLRHVRCLDSSICFRLQVMAVISTFVCVPLLVLRDGKWPKEKRAQLCGEKQEAFERVAQLCRWIEN